MVLRVYITPFGSAFKSKSSMIDFHHSELWERYSCNSCIFFFVFNVISPFSPLMFLCFVVINLYYLLVIDRFYASVTESLGVFSYCIGVHNKLYFKASVSEVYNNLDQSDD